MDDEEWVIEDPSTAEPEPPPAEEAPAEAPAEEAKPEEAEPPPPENLVMGTGPKKLVFKHWVR